MYPDIVELYEFFQVLPLNYPNNKDHFCFDIKINDQIKFIFTFNESQPFISTQIFFQNNLIALNQVQLGFSLEFNKDRDILFANFAGDMYLKISITRFTCQWNYSQTTYANTIDDKDNFQNDSMEKQLSQYFNQPYIPILNNDNDGYLRIINFKVPIFLNLEFEFECDCDYRLVKTKVFYQSYLIYQSIKANGQSIKFSNKDNMH